MRVVGVLDADAQPWFRQYSSWLVICASVRSGRKEKVP